MPNSDLQILLCLTPDDFTLSNTRRFYSSKGDPSGTKGLKTISFKNSRGGGVPKVKSFEGKDATKLKFPEGWRVGLKCKKKPPNGYEFFVKQLILLICKSFAFCFLVTQFIYLAMLLSNMSLNLN